MQSSSLILRIDVFEVICLSPTGSAESEIRPVQHHVVDSTQKTSFGTRRGVLHHLAPQGIWSMTTDSTGPDESKPCQLGFLRWLRRTFLGGLLGSSNF